jgi:hypothetical protein
MSHRAGNRLAQGSAPPYPGSRTRPCPGWGSSYTCESARSSSRAMLYRATPTLRSHARPVRACAARSCARNCGRSCRRRRSGPEMDTNVAGPESPTSGFSQPADFACPLVPLWYRLLGPMCPDRPRTWTERASWTLTDSSTPEAGRLGAERSPVQIRPPDDSKPVTEATVKCQRLPRPPVAINSRCRCAARPPFRAIVRPGARTRPRAARKIR